MGADSAATLPVRSYHLSNPQMMVTLQPTHKWDSKPKPEGVRTLGGLPNPLLASDIACSWRDDDPVPGINWPETLRAKASTVIRLKTAAYTVRFFVAHQVLASLAPNLNGVPKEGILVPSSGCDRKLHDHATAVLERLKDTNSSADLLATYAALNFLLFLIKNYSFNRAGSHQTGGLAGWQIQKIERHVAENIGKASKIGSLADLCKLSVGQFSRAFRKTNGMPPHQWVMWKRVQAAKELMQASDETQADIASNCGFTDQSHFIRIFSKYEGTTPGLWRKSISQIGLSV